MDYYNLSIKNLIVKKNTKSKIDKNIISIPKKIVKKANKRNKIRRQIKAILREKNVKNMFIQYVDLDEKPIFKTIKEEILKKIK